MAFAAGQKPTAAEMNRLPGQVIARGKRTSSSTTTTTEQGVLRLDDVPVKAGRIYKVCTNTLVADTSVANDVVGAYLRYTEDGSTPTTSSTILGRAQVRLADAATAELLEASASYAPASDLNLSVLLTCIRVGGTGTVILFGGTNNPIELFIIDMGDDPGDTGTDV